MPLILSIDTTAHFGSLALWRPPDDVDEILLHSPEGFGHILIPQVERLLKRNQISLAQIDAFAAASGPGSFTGVRVGLAASKGLAEATGKPLIAVSNLKALAAISDAPLRAAVLDARRGEIYGAVYDAELNLVQAEVVAPFAAWLKSLPQEPLEFIAQDFTPFRAALAGTAWADAPILDGQRAIAGAVARVASKEFAAGVRPDAAAADANYVRRSDAELFWKE